MTETNDRRKRADLVLSRLKLAYPNPKPALVYTNPLQCLVATILSAQCTDARVNLVTPELFRKYRNASDYASAEPAELEAMIHSTGFFRSKAKSIIGASKAIVERHHGTVPDTMEQLLRLDGVGRKTANCILGNVYNQPAVMVDTHVKRLTWRMELTDNTDPDKIEMDIRTLYPESQWMPVSHALIYHGRNVCVARKPACHKCTVNDVCPKRDVNQGKK